MALVKHTIRLSVLLFVASHAQGAIEGRYVRMEMPTPGQHYMDVAEVEVFSGQENVALRGQASALTQRAHPNVVIDGEKGGDKVHSSKGGDAHHWLEIDLGRRQAIDRIVVWPRRNMAGRLDGFLLTILDEQRRVVWHQRTLWARQAAMEIKVTPFAGRYVGAEVPAGVKGWYDLSTERREDYQPMRPVEEIAIQAPPDAARRREIFAQRESDAAVEALCRRFAAALDTKAAGLEAFREHFGRGDYRGALDAYRAFFFSKDMPKVELAGANPFAVDALRNNGRIRMNRDSVTVGEIGPPGAAAWAPYGLRAPPGVFSGMYNDHSFWKTEAGREALAKIEFFTEVRGPTFANFDDLLLLYAAGGAPDSLALWMDYLDDWCLFGLEDIHASPLGLVWATEFGASLARKRLSLLKSTAAARPEFATKVRSTTLARYVLTMIESLPPYSIRAKRTELANWGTMAVTDLLKLHKEMPEFIAVQRYRNEAWRLWQSEWIHRNAPDATGAEASEGPYRYVALGHFPLGCEMPWSEEVNAMAWQEMVDHARGIFRHALGETPQTGVGFKHRDNVAWRERKDAFFDEPETQARLAIFEKTPPQGEPSVLSEMMAYGGKYILRENWRPDGEFFYMANFRFGSQNPQLRTGYSLSRGNSALPSSGAGIHYETSPLYGYPILVDKRGPHPKQGVIPRVGGKTVYLDRAASQVVDTRFHTSGRFDLAEAKQDAPYALRTDLWEHYWKPHAPQNSFVWGPHTAALAKQNDTVVSDVVTWRQVFSVRGENLYIVSDRIESQGEHDYAACFYLNLPLETDKLKELKNTGQPVVQSDAAALSARTTVPGERNLALRFFGSLPLQMFNRFDRNGNYETFAGGDKVDLKADYDPGELMVGAKPVADEVYEKAYPVGVHGRGRGNQVLIAVHQTLPVTGAGADPASADMRDLKRLEGAGGVAGFSALTRNGTQVWYQAGAQASNDLEAGPAKVRAETLLATMKNGELSGVVLTAASDLTLNGRAFKAPSESFEFVLGVDGAFSATPIRRPIDTVRILPAQNVFTDSIQVSFAIPTQKTDDVEFRYTLDGSDVTIASKLFTEPFTLNDTTLVKVRAFRKGLKATPYRQCGTESSETFHALFTHEVTRPAVAAAPTGAGLHYLYYEDPVWPRLFAHAGVEGVLDVKAKGEAAKLLDADEVAKTRRTDGPYAIVYRGYLKVPQGGVYAFHAPEHLYNVTADAGFDLRVFVDGEEWRPTARLHAENTWYVPLAAGAHKFEARFVDFRHKPWRNEWWMTGHKEIVWQGIPVLEVSGPGVARRPIPSEWLGR